VNDAKKLREFEKAAKIFENLNADTKPSSTSTAGDNENTEIKRKKFEI
jgi:hypothetical protein